MKKDQHNIYGSAARTNLIGQNRWGRGGASEILCDAPTPLLTGWRPQRSCFPSSRPCVHSPSLVRLTFDAAPSVGTGGIKPISIFFLFFGKSKTSVPPPPPRTPRGRAPRRLLAAWYGTSAVASCSSFGRGRAPPCYSSAALLLGSGDALVAGYGCGFVAYRYVSIFILCCCRPGVLRFWHAVGPMLLGICLLGLHLTDSISIEPSLAVISSYLVTVLAVRIFTDPV